ncbi:hypothetical protein [Streptomyces sp. NPDC021608]|uniref:hypothetical protein n=1 Tax=Streptomyces sp. NPDC021608 TaxID=3154903 RepID=UPI0033F9DC40
MSGPHDFDFLHGEWVVRHRRRTDFLDGDSPWEEFASTAACRPLFDGAANIDEIDMPHLGAKGLTLRLFDPRTRQWSLHWSSSLSGRLFPPVIGGFGDGDERGAAGLDRGVFYGDDVHDGQEVRARFVWSGVSEAAARWEQAFSPDGGRTWLTNWVMDFTRPGGTPPGAPVEAAPKAVCRTP